MLIDRATIFVRSGKGGDGCMSFRREKFAPKGGPNGGDGGNGGDIVLECDPSLSTLLPLTPRPHYRAEKGKQGMGQSMHGADGADLVIKIPPGTLVFDAADDRLIVDLNEPGHRHVIAAGGRGGYGNEHFKHATNQAPRETTPGEPAIELTLRLELKLIADVGLVGMPNAGKSTLLTAVSRARPKVADYPFTTLKPHLGIAQLSIDRRLIIADIPGLIEGAAGGAGLGHDFLRHIDRTKVIVHVLDLAPIDGSDPAANFLAIRRELERYSTTLAEKLEIVALNKTDLVHEDELDERVAEVTAAIGAGPGRVVIPISGATNRGIPELLERCWSALGAEPAEGWTSA